MDNTSAFSISALLEHDIQELKGKRLADVFRLISFIPGETYGPHSHLRIEINYVKKGSCILHLEQESITFREGELMFITPNPTLTLQRKISLFSMFFVSETADNQFCVCR